jgi:hypothetical protein
MSRETPNKDQGERPTTIQVELDRDLAGIYLKGATRALPRMVEAVAHVDQSIQEALGEQ